MQWGTRPVLTSHRRHAGGHSRTADAKERLTASPPSNIQRPQIQTICGRRFFKPKKHYTRGDIAAASKCRPT